MKNFLDTNFLLDSKTAEGIYAHIESLPIIDYHCHLDAKEIYENQPFETITDAWLGFDHYKFRAMRMMGVNENLITGNAPKYDKFVAWATVLDSLVGHPLYHFSHMELKKYFDIDIPLCQETAKEIYEKANLRLKELTPQQIIEMSNVEVVITTNDPIENLAYHAKLKAEADFKTRVLPAFRPDKAMSIEKDGFKEYVKALEKATGCMINDIEGLKDALAARLDYFKEFGCLASDHGFDFVPYDKDCEILAEMAFKKVMFGQCPTQKESDAYRASLLIFLAREYKMRDIVMEIHFGVHRNANARMLGRIGVDSGFDTIRANTNADNLVYLLDRINNLNALPKTILFSLNPNDLVAYATISGSFQTEGIKGYVQPGAAWWFNDTKIGIKRHLEEYSSLAPLDTFIGMLTDSRSLLSYARHDYFRRILANYLGSLLENGEYPEKRKQKVVEIAKNISYYNALSFVCGVKL